MTNMEGNGGMTRQNVRRIWGGAVILLCLAILALGHAIEQTRASTIPIENKMIPLKPSLTFVKASFLTGELQDLRVSERIERKTGKVVGAPVLRATLKVTNDSKIQAARLIGGRIEYQDANGRTIPAADTSFPFIGIPTDRLDPGKETSQAIEVPFPPAGLGPHAVREVSLELTYLPIPYRQDTMSFPVSVGG